jgi:signal transduction histidine kinase
MRQVLANRLSNAVKYTRSCNPAIIEIGQIQVDGGPAFFVRDNGVGFDMLHAHKLFAPFQRLHGDDFEGIGIGLATVQRIILKHGGRIWAHSEPGRGSTFYFTLGGCDRDPRDATVPASVPAVATPEPLEA